MAIVQIVVPDAVRLHDVSSSASSPITRSAVVLLVLTTVPHEHSSAPTSDPRISYTMFFDSSAGSEFSTPVIPSQPTRHVTRCTTYDHARHTSRAAPRSGCEELSCLRVANLTSAYPEAQSQYTTRCMLRSSPTKHCDGLPSISLQARVMMMHKRQSHIHGLQLACDLRVETILDHRDAVESQIAEMVRCNPKQAD